MTTEIEFLVKLEMTFSQLCFSSRPKKAAKPDKIVQWLTSESDAMTNEPLPQHQPISKDHNPERIHLKNLMNIILRSSPRKSFKIPAVREGIDKSVP